jgi:protein-S-isoprenylcysteine O-methyltransferase Ste14
MYMGEAAVWSGWAIYFGCLPVLAGLAVHATAWSAALRLEERALARKFGRRYRAYGRRVPRWIGLPRGRRRR